jgi:Mn-dependent DtxR family transcriptional regulator
MSIDTLILRAMLRLSRRREAAEEESLVLRAAASRAAVRDSLRRLEALGLVERRVDRAPRLTMEGLAAAVALLPARAAGQARGRKRTSRAA